MHSSACTSTTTARTGNSRPEHFTWSFLLRAESSGDAGRAAEKAVAAADAEVQEAAGEARAALAAAEADSSAPPARRPPYVQRPC